LQLLDPPIRLLVDRLGDDDPTVRDAAQRDLSSKMDESAFEQINALLHDEGSFDDPEARRRLEAILRQKLPKIISDLDDQIQKLVRQEEGLQDGSPALAKIVDQATNLTEKEEAATNELKTLTAPPPNRTPPLDVSPEGVGGGGKAPPPGAR
jgi:hypothetical protein